MKKSIKISINLQIKKNRKVNKGKKVIGEE